jgi:hypothetical protein
VQQKYLKIQFLNASEKRIESELKFSVECKNTGVVYTYDLSKKKYSQEFRDIVSIFVWAVYKRRNVMGHLSREAVFEVGGRFFDFLADSGIYQARELSAQVLRSFGAWLKMNRSLSYSTAGSMYRKLTPIFKQMSAHPVVSDDFIAVKNMFPKSTSLVSTNVGYDQGELKRILRAAVDGMKEAASRHEIEYKPRWLGEPAPLDDVAPVWLKARSYWASEKYRVWWWENNCDCQRLKVTDLYSIPQGQSFFSSTAPPGERATAKHLNKFYDRIGAGENYEPKFLGAQCPILYLTPWKKKDYVIWYWENKIGCKALTMREIKEVDYKFYKAVQEHMGGRIKAFYEELGIYRWVRGDDLIPYYILLLIRTQLNPSTIQRLTVDCLVPDPLQDGRVMIDWTKFRSSKKGKTIPSDKQHDGWPAMLVKKILRITERIREDGQEDLWIANANRYKVSRPLGRSAFKRGLVEFSKRHNLMSRDGTPFIIQARLIRPTMAWSEYMRTEDMTYLQSLLGHSKLSTTAEYLRRVDDPVALSRRAVHQQAMFIGALSNRLDSGDNQDASHSSLFIDKAAIHENQLNHCSAPMNSPVPGQKLGVACSANSEVCLGCQNLVVTLIDIKKYFCFMNFYDYLLSSGEIAEEEYRKAVMDKRHIWDGYILKKYDPGVVERIRLDALANPVPEWDVALYER